MRGSGLVSGGYNEWRPKLRGEAKQVEIGGHHADHRVVFAVEPDGATDQRSIGTKAALPKLVAEDNDMVAARLVFAVGEVATKLRGNIENGEIIGSDSG